MTLAGDPSRWKRGSLSNVAGGAAALASIGVAPSPRGLMARPTHPPWVGHVVMTVG